ncbi:putative bifunctional diguanylate cyclase/phosphodiesterase [Sporosarcina beigongshangi]|uniref:putative bifunctional diguanylate cyclase/phosphodiesterase n=1 Tax=Sporosarcina beigongshangi TaxID=2782538 RepID=UPI0019396ADF|nr:EAL domain-containing protein [Sporosarcina beigongshangi]
MHFIKPSEHLIELQGEYSYPIIFLSILIACVASYTALSMNKRAQQRSFFHRNFWLSLASIAMGFGIWSMHFVGMSAFSLPVSMHYDRLLTIISVFPAMFASFLAFYIANRPKKLFWSYGIASVVMGIGISTMHYVGMAAMKMEALHVYNAWLFTASILIAIVVSFIALYVFSTLQRYMENHFIQLMTAIILGLAVSSMHYTGMIAMSFYVSPDHSHTSTAAHEVQMSFIVISVTIGMALLLSLLLLSSLLDRYVKYRTNHFDMLTRLPNRRQFEKKLSHSSVKQTLAIWHFHDMEKINRENGYLYGDGVLQSISEIMVNFNPPQTDLYRIEGNRFAFLGWGTESETMFKASMEKIAQMLRDSTVFQEKEIVLQAVCAWLPASQQNDATKTYSNVLAVLNSPSLQYKFEIILYNPAVHTYTFEREIASDVERAMAEDELYLVFQPKINSKTREIAGVETLLRWKHPTYGVLSPAVFIPILEANNQMLDVTDWVIERACRQLAQWRHAGEGIEHVAVNIPGQYVTSSRLLKVLKQTVTHYGLEPELLELEITETSFVRSIDEAIRAVRVFRQEGFSVALDDFGTGVSSLSYLKQMPISTMKIDKSFVDEVPMSEKDSAIIQAIIALGDSLNLSIVFEGVETEEQVQFLASTCEQPIIQGYYFAKPMIASELIAWARTFRQSV